MTAHDIGISNNSRLLFRPSCLVSGLAYPLLRLSTLECLTSLADVRPTLPSADFWLPARSPEVSSAAFRAQSPDLRFACLMDMDFAVTRPLVPRSRLISGFCSSTRAFAPRFLQTPPRDSSPCASLILHLHQVGWKTYTSELLNMLGTRVSLAELTQPPAKIPAPLRGAKPQNLVA